MFMERILNENMRPSRVGKSENAIEHEVITPSLRRTQTSTLFHIFFSPSQLFVSKIKSKQQSGIQLQLNELPQEDFCMF